MIIEKENTAELRESAVSDMTSQGGHLLLRSAGGGDADVG